MKAAQVFIVGKSLSSKEGNTAWEFQGVFATEGKAVAACRDHFYFVGPAVMDESLPHETLPDWPGAYYPIQPPPERGSWIARFLYSVCPKPGF